jgi:hypothetical protein
MKGCKVSNFNVNLIESLKSTINVSESVFQNASNIFLKGLVFNLEDTDATFENNEFKKL